MDHLRAALQRFRVQQGKAGQRPQSEWAGGRPASPPQSERPAAEPVPPPRSTQTAGRPASSSQSDQTAGPSVAPPAVSYTETRSLHISRSVLREHRVMAGYDRGPFVDAFKILRTQVLRRLRKHDWNVLGVTSPGYGDGKTLTAVNLAVSIAMDSAQTVLLADSDLTHPSLHEVWDLNEDGPGLTDYLLYDKPVQDLLVHPGIARLVLLPGGRPVSNSTEFLTSPKMLALVEELKHRYPSRIIIFDLPPLLTTADAIAFAPSMDALLLVVEEGKTTADDVQRAFSLVKDSCPVLGTVLNKAGQLAASPASMKKALSF